MFLHALLWTFCRLIYHWHSIKVILIKSEKILHCQLWEANEAITANLDRDEHIVEHALTTVPIETVNLNSFFFMKLQNLLRGRKTRRRNRTKRTTWKAETTTRNRWTPMTLSTTDCFLQNIPWNGKVPDDNHVTKYVWRDIEELLMTKRKYDEMNCTMMLKSH